MASAARRPRKDPAAQRRQSQIIGAIAILAAAIVPVAMWWDVAADIAEASPGLTTALVVGFAPWVLMSLGLLCTIPIAVEHLRNRERRFYRPGSGAWVGWGVSLYLLGFGLGTQVAQIHGRYA